jgi:PhnB protein
VFDKPGGCLGRVNRAHREDEQFDTMNEIAGVPTVIPVLAVEHIQKAIAFYSQLGFSEVFSIPDQSGKLAHAHLRKGDSALFLGRLDVSHYEGHRRAETISGSRSIGRGIGITLILHVDNLASVYDFVRREKLEVLAEPLDEYYGDRVFFFLDPFGYEWKISQPIPANTPPHHR